jgi:hypothetical protein
VLAMFAKVDAKLGRLTALVNNAGVVDITPAGGRNERARCAACSTSTCWARSVRARGRAAHEHPPRRRRWRDRQCVQRCIAAGLAGPVPGLCGGQGRHRRLDPGPGQGSGRRGHPCQRGAPGPDRDRHPCLRRLAQPGARPGAQVPMQRGGTADEVAQAIVWLLSDEASYTTMSWWTYPEAVDGLFLDRKNHHHLLGRHGARHRARPGQVTPTAEEIMRVRHAVRPPALSPERVRWRGLDVRRLCASGWHTCAWPCG